MSLDPRRHGGDFLAGTPWVAAQPWMAYLVTSADAGGLPWTVLLSMARQESGPWWMRGAEIPERVEPHLDPPDRSIGILQILTRTAAEVVGGEELDGIPIDQVLRSPASNLHIGAMYLRSRWDAYGEIPDAVERLWCAIAAYNAGRGNVNQALSLARAAEGMPAGYGDWDSQGREPGKWQTLEYWGAFLPKVTGDSAGITLDYLGHVRHWSGELALLAELHPLAT